MPFSFSKNFLILSSPDFFFLLTVKHLLDGIILSSWVIDILYSQKYSLSFFWDVLSYFRNSFVLSSLDFKFIRWFHSSVWSRVNYSPLLRQIPWEYFIQIYCELGGFSSLSGRIVSAPTPCEYQALIPLILSDASFPSLYFLTYMYRSLFYWSQNNVSGTLDTSPACFLSSAVSSLSSSLTYKL